MTPKDVLSTISNGEDIKDVKSIFAEIIKRQSRTEVV
jgi:hypothetical protein